MRKSPLDPALLCRHWMRSVEEEKRGSAEQLYRPAGARPFPPSRFRMQYRFYKSGKCDWRFLSPDDSHRFVPGAWRVEAAHPPVLRIVQGKETVSFRVLSLTKDALRLQPLPA